MTRLYALLLSFCYVSIFATLVGSDEEWIAQTDDIGRLANAAIKEMKRTSSIHLFDDLQLIEIVKSKKSIAAYSRSLELVLRMKSDHYKDGSEEKDLSFIVLQHKLNGKYSFAMPTFPVMKESYINQMEDVWTNKHREQREEHFEELKAYASSDEFENQDYL